MTFDAEGVRADFPALAGRVHGRPLIYLDNAATAQMPRPVMEAVMGAELRRGNVHRGIHALSEESTAAYERARESVARAIGGAAEELIFTAGTTDGINRAALAMQELLPAGAGVAVTAMEHHSNLLPWQRLCERRGTELGVIPLTARGDLDYGAAERLLAPGGGILAVTHCSNVLGTVNDIPRLCRLARARDWRVLVDGAQSVCHRAIDVRALGCDWFAFSGHKLGAPFGVGALWCREPLPPVFLGGGMVDAASARSFTPAAFPQSGEAGTPNVSGAVGLAAALAYRENLPQGWREHEKALLRMAEEGLRGMDGVRVLGAPGTREGALSFTLDGVQPFDAAALLDGLGVALRSGHHCAQPLLQGLGVSHALRVSPAFYNTPGEIESFLAALRRVLGLLRLSKNAEGVL